MGFLYTLKLGDVMFFENLWKEISTLNEVQSIALAGSRASEKYDEKFNNLTLGYGGSINSNNVHDIVNNDEINAILVGSSSLNEKEFANIVNLSS